MKIAIIGYGKMGKEIEALALAKGHEIVLKIHVDNLHEFTIKNIQKADVAIEFTTPQTAVVNIQKCFQANVPVVVGTTGWYEHLNEVVEKCNVANAALFYATNFSIGVNLFLHINRYVADLMKNFAYELSIDEIHHTQKLDAPSGTAITLAEEIMKNYPPKKKWTNQIVTSIESKKNTNFPSDELYIRSYREENIPGTHLVRYESQVDTIELQHVAHNRKGFAMGAITAAEWLIGKKGVFTMNDMLSF